MASAKRLPALIPVAALDRSMSLMSSSPEAVIPESLAGPAPRHRTVGVRVGSVMVGGGAPIVVQSMTNTDTADVESTVSQIKSLARAGSELVRVTVNTDEAAAAVPA